MTEHEQRVAIAEWMGWQPPKEESILWTLDNPEVKGNFRWANADHLPDYTRDLNAMAEAEQHLGDVNQLNAYADALDKVCVPTHICSLTHWQSVVMASAAQRAEALLRCLNLWKEP